MSIQLNLGMMVDGNARATYVSVLNDLNVSPEDVERREAEIVERYLQELPRTYIRNAKWCVRLGEELLSRTRDSDYVIFIYNMSNRRRTHFRSIENAINEVCGELIERLGIFGDVCIAGHTSEKAHWKGVFPKLKDVGKADKGRRTILLMGYQRGEGEDPNATNIRHLDYFIRSTQLRFSGMFLPCMDNTHSIVLSHIPYRYDPAALIEKLVEVKKADEEHNELNIYSKSVYDLWLEHENKPLSMYVTTNALPPMEHFFG